MNQVRILIVDDEEGMRLAIFRVLKQHTMTIQHVNEPVGFIIETAATGNEALEKMTAAPPDILLLDHRLPDISGLDILKKMAEKKADWLTIMITAYASLDTAVQAIKLGAYDFLAKPFTPDELKASVFKASKHLLWQQQAKNLAEEKQKFRFQMISMVAHELKSPIAAIDGYLQVIKQRAAGTELNDYDAVLDRCSVRLDGMRNLISDLLDVARIESGQRKRKIVPVDLWEQIRSSLENVSVAAANRQITLKTEGDPPLTLLADPDEIAIILNNLISNAVKYNRETGSVTVSAKKEENSICIQVTDTGIGMTEEEAGQLFGEFVRFKNKKNKDVLGSGLGLSIVKKIVQLYHGTITVRSTPDVGTTFTVVIQEGGE